MENFMLHVPFLNCETIFTRSLPHVAPHVARIYKLVPVCQITNHLDNYDEFNITL